MKKPDKWSNECLKQARKMQISLFKSNVILLISAPVSSRNTTEPTRVINLQKQHKRKALIAAYTFIQIAKIAESLLCLHRRAAGRKNPTGSR